MPSQRVTRNTNKIDENNRKDPLPPPVPEPVKKSKVSEEPEEWVEPPVQNLASWMQQKLDKNPLFETMYPLGTPPPATLLAKLKKLGGGTQNKKLSVQALNKVGDDSATITPQLTPPAENGAASGAQDSSTTNEEDPSSTSYPVSNHRNLSIDVENPDLVTDEIRPSTPTSTQPAADPVTPNNPTVPREPLTRTPQQKDVMDRVIGVAVDKAKSEKLTTMGEAVQRLYEQSHYDQEKCDTIDAVMTGVANEEQRRLFGIELLSARSDIRAERRALRQSVSLQNSPQIEQNGADPTPPDSQPMSRNQSTSSNQSTDNPPPVVARTTTLSGMEPRRSQRKRNTRGASNQPPSRPPSPPLSSVPKLSSPIKMNDKIKSEELKPAGRITRAQKQRRGSNASDLSSVNEEIISMGLPDPPRMAAANSKRNQLEAEFYPGAEEIARRQRVLASLEARRVKTDTQAEISDIRFTTPRNSGITLNFTGLSGGRASRSRATTPAVSTQTAQGLNFTGSTRPELSAKLTKQNTGGARVKIS
jgi:hypothetical protein